MANASTTLARSSNFRGLARDIFQTLTILSDDADGSVDSQDLIGLDDCIGTELEFIPDSVATPSGTVEVRIENSDGNPVYLSGSIDATVYSRSLMTQYTGNYPKIDGTVTVKLVDPSDHTSDCDIGNAKECQVKIRFEKKS